MSGTAGAGSGTAPPGWALSLLDAARRAPVPSALSPPSQGGRHSAVLILFGPGASGPDILLIQRTNGLRRHSGQPAFPGGRLEPTDNGPEDAALREAAEETGLDPSGVRVLGRLPELYIRRTAFRVTPVLAWWHTPSEVRPADPAEVSGVARVPVGELAAPANQVRVREPDGGIRFAYRVRGMLVWGFTAAILRQLLELGGWDQPRLRDGTEGAEPVVVLPQRPPDNRGA
ncbi:NUDIX domain-containing protein [Haloactinospora alba]|uniref:NUDIX domain-containing protein n=1 Tax=Haloactinospora alba TaxID=405555 RepID=A0A543NA36_9ACTN|nr:CoA pyrophosphatase [Haloactinospora alba]TQN28697.1 NUDIX domain-containing protein [Haloactinospora alba]